MSRVVGSHCIKNSSIKILLSIDGRGSTELGISRAWIRRDSAKNSSCLSLLLTRRRKARKRYELRSRILCWLIAFALMTRETAAAASSSRFAATAGSMSSFSAWRKARRPISSAALRTAGLIGRPRRSTELTRTPPRSGCAFSAIGSHLQRRTIPKKVHYQTVRPTIPPKEEEYRLEPKPQLTTTRSIPRAAVKSPDGPREPVELLVGRYSAEPYVGVARGWNCDRQRQGRYDYCLLWDTNPQSVNTGPGLVEGVRRARDVPEMWTENSRFRKYAGS
jgi:hypothetical protein